MSKSITNNVLNSAECVIINEIPLMIKEYNNHRVVTFKDIDTVHERPEGTARRNFNANKMHFIEGEDYYLVKPSDIQMNEIRTSEINNRGTTLITESGYLMLAKSLTDELAWQVQRELVNTYFRAREIISMVQGLADILFKMQSEISGLKSALETKPTQPNYWLWKKHIVAPAIENLSDAYGVDTRTAYDIVYNSMSAAFGFDRSFAINQFCTKYGIETTSVIDAIADCPQYQSEFVQTVNNLINTVTLQNQVVKQLPSADKVQSVIDPLIKKLGDKSVNGARTYGKVYSMIATARGWKLLLTRYRCSTKKQVLMKNDKKYRQFVNCVNKLMEEGDENE